MSAQSPFWSDFVSGLSPYVPGEQPKVDNLVKLNTNEFPYAPSPKVLQAIKEAVGASIRLYPDPESTALRQSIAHFYDLDVSNIFVGNGSDEVLAHVFYAFFKHKGKKVLFPDITYSFYPVYCGLYDIDYQTIALNDDFEIDIRDYDFATADTVSAIIFANPNAPTGIALGLDQIEELLQKHPDILIVVDEAYVDFGGESCANLLNKYKNLLLLQTFSKSRALAGMRAGFAAGSVELVDALTRIKNSFNSYPLDRLCQAAAIAAMQDKEYFEQTCEKVITTRENLVQALKKLGFSVLPSKANFIFVKHSGYNGDTLYQLLRQKNILVRHFKSERINQYLRITIGTDSECELLLKSLAEILS